MVAGAIAGRAKPAVAPGFPGGERALPHEPRFPGAPPPSRAVIPARRGDTEERSTSSSVADAKLRSALDRTSEGAEGVEGMAGGTVTHLSNFRRPGGRAEADAPDMEHFHNLIVGLSESAELVTASYSARNADYTWIRLDLGSHLTMIKSQLEQMAQWLARAGMTDDLSTFDLRHSLLLYAGTADEFVRAARSLESRRSSSEQRILLDDYQAASGSLSDLLWRIHREFAAVQRAPGPSGLR